MKKTVILLVVLVLAFTSVTALSAGDKSQDVLVTFQDGRSESFEWEVPESIALTEVNSSSDQTCKIIKSSLREGNGIKVTVDGSGTLTLTNSSSGDSINGKYSLTGLQNGFVSLSDGKGSWNLHVDVNEAVAGSVIYTGTYTGSITMKAEIAKK